MLTDFEPSSASLRCCECADRCSDVVFSIDSSPLRLWQRLLRCGTATDPDWPNGRASAISKIAAPSRRRQMSSQKWSLLLLWLVARFRRAFLRLGFRCSSHLSLLAFAKVDTMSNLGPSIALNSNSTKVVSCPPRRIWRAMRKLAEELIFLRQFPEAARTVFTRQQRSMCFSSGCHPFAPCPRA